MKAIFEKWGLLALTLFTFFILLGSRSLNEPDEGRYSEVAREMIETGNWLVPHLWYLPHLDKPPMTYWLVAVSMKVFGQNEWAARLPAAFAGISGVWAAFLLGCSLGGRRAGMWSAVILQSSLLYFVMARMLTPDIFLTQFVAWAVYFWWKSWECLERGDMSPLSKAPTCRRTPKIFAWHWAGWAAIALGFLTKGPIALAIPLAALVALVICRWRTLQRKGMFFSGLAAGFVLFLLLAAPWFLAVFQRVPESAHYMILGQAAGHLLGTTIKNRPGGPLYFFGILAVGFLPWTWLLGWLWRLPNPQSTVRSPESEIQSVTGNRQSAIFRDGWLMLKVWAIFTFVLFSLARAKLPAYILPIFPALAVLLAVRFFSSERETEPAARFFPWRLCLISPLLMLSAAPLALVFAFHNALSAWMVCQMSLAAGAAILLLWLPKAIKPAQCAGLTAGLALFSLVTIAAEAPAFEASFRGNQTLKPLGVALRENYRSGDALVCWGKFPQGLPFYSGTVISASSRPYFGGMDLTQVPFEFPGNRERLGNLLLPDENSLAQLLESGQRVWIIGPVGAVEEFRKTHIAYLLRRVMVSGQWELFVNR
jgi:4-amino-4-deoxy-L-arabinose transferase-like glycosyltransferase